MMKYFPIIGFILLIFNAKPSFGSHNIAGEITFRSIGDPASNEYEITLTTYTNTESDASRQRETVDVYLGYGSPEKFQSVKASVWLERIQPIGSNIYRNVYIFNHKFPGNGCYNINYTDEYRVENIVNVNNGQSDNIDFYIESMLCIASELGDTYNNSPILLEIPISYACLDNIYIHNPNAYDKDGDSLYFSIIPPKESTGTPVQGYLSPEKIAPGGTFGIDSYTGELTWNTPKGLGIYNIAILIEEWRTIVTSDGKLRRMIGNITRDMQIRVSKCNNDPPEIVAINDTCVVAGLSTVLTINVKATDPNPGDLITLTASGGPFLLDKSPADNFGKVNGLSPVGGKFSWRIDCSHIRKEPYRVVFNATDNGGGFPGQELTDIEHVDIRVLGPDPRNLSAEGIGNGIQLKWDPPVCGLPVIAYFIYRKISNSTWIPGLCENGVPGSTGFQRIATLKTSGTQTYYDDDLGEGLFHGITYCYRITALYLNEGQFESVEGISSYEVCAELRKDVPILFEATVNSTSKDKGEIELAWTSPSDLDTITFPGPYEYRVMHSTDLKGTAFTEIKKYTSSTFHGLLTDTSLVVGDLNTAELAHSFEIQYYFTDKLTGNLDLVGTAKSASAPWLQIDAGFKKLSISVQSDVPWQNTGYQLFKYNNISSQWDSIDYNATGNFEVENLLNGLEYCFYAKTIGSFFGDDMPDPIINLSQENCGIPRDTIPPCPPIATAEARCRENVNFLSWKFKDDNCAFDVVGYNIYYSYLGKEKYVKIDSIQGDATLSQYLDDRPELQENLAGCYLVTAIDSYRNESKFVDTLCVNNCPDYRLPNVFTPSFIDEKNDIFRPFPYKYVSHAEIKILNRWGQLVFETNDPDILWDGTDMYNHKPLAPGVYFITATITFRMLYLPQVKKLQGTITLIR